MQKGSAMWCSLINSCVRAGLGSKKLEWTGLCSHVPHRLSLTDWDFSATCSSSQPSFLCSQVLMPKILIPELNLGSCDDRVCGKKFVKESENCLLGPEGGDWMDREEKTIDSETAWFSQAEQNCISTCVSYCVILVTREWYQCFVYQ